MTDCKRESIKRNILDETDKGYIKGSLMKLFEEAAAENPVEAEDFQTFIEYIPGVILRIVFEWKLPPLNLLQLDPNLHPEPATT